MVADLTAPAMLFVQSIGRLGDIVNGEHCAKLTDQFYGFVWRSNDSAASWCGNGLNASVQPVIALEIIWNLSVLFVIWKLRNRLRPAGMIFALYLGFYAIGRFLITFLRDDKIWSMGLQEAHFIAIVVLIIVVPLLAFKARFGNPEDVINEFRAIAPQKSRAERRRED